MELGSVLKLRPPFPSTSSNHWVPKFVSLLSNSSFLKVMLIYLSPSTYRQVVHACRLIYPLCWLNSVNRRPPALHLWTSLRGFGRYSRGSVWIPGLQLYRNSTRKNCSE